VSHTATSMSNVQLDSNNTTLGSECVYCFMRSKVNNPTLELFTEQLALSHNVTSGAYYSTKSGFEICTWRGLPAARALPSYSSCGSSSPSSASACSYTAECSCRCFAEGFRCRLVRVPQTSCFSAFSFSCVCDESESL
jgi:hypothetical protein